MIGNILIRRPSGSFTYDPRNAFNIEMNIFRPFWEQINGLIVSGGDRMDVPIGNIQQQTIRTLETKRGSQYDIYLTYDGVPTIGDTTFYILYLDVNNNVAIINDLGADTLNLVITTAGAPFQIGAGRVAIPGVEPHFIRVTRTEAGLWEAFLDGVSFGSDSDPYDELNIEYRIDNTSDAPLFISEIRVDRPEW